MRRLQQGDRTIKEQSLGKQKMANDTAFKFQKIIEAREAKNWKRVHRQKVSMRKETIKIKFMVTFSYSKQCLESDY